MKPAHSLLVGQANVSSRRKTVSPLFRVSSDDPASCRYRCFNDSRMREWRGDIAPSVSLSCCQQSAPPADKTLSDTLSFLFSCIFGFLLFSKRPTNPLTAFHPVVNDLHLQSEDHFIYKRRSEDRKRKLSDCCLENLESGFLLPF